MVNNKIFTLESSYFPGGDQPDAISKLTSSILSGEKSQVLLGVTGSGKTFTMANIIQNLGRPTIIMAHNKTLAAQLFTEMKGFFPHNAVEYFVSYYDYYQPEAYLPRSNTYIEKDSVTNEDLDRLRHSATRSLLERRDAVVVASVSSLYGIGSPDIYGRMIVDLREGMEYPISLLIETLVKLQYKRNDIDFNRGDFRMRGDIIDIFPSYADNIAIKVEYFGDVIESIWEIDPLTNNKISKIEIAKIYPNSHYATPLEVVKGASAQILEDMENEVNDFKRRGKFLEAERLEQRTRYDIEMMQETGSCKGIENYSRYLTGRSIGDPPPTLFEYIPDDALLIVDESHVSIPQIRAMYAGDRARKDNLVQHGFRIRAALDNRPLNFDEWYKIKPQTIYVSATPSEFEILEAGQNIVEQIIRPTGLLDPVCEVRPVLNQVDDIVSESKVVINQGFRVLITTLTKKMAEDLNDYLLELGMKSTYMHSDVETLERISIIQGLRSGKFDILIGVNLLREGIDLPECALVGIMDADKEGFLRSKTSLIQLIGRAARNSEGRVILYADTMTKSLDAALIETKRRRELQIEYNQKNGIVPRTILKSHSNPFDDILGKMNNDKSIAKIDPNKISYREIEKAITETKELMKKYAKNLEFEEAARLRDELASLQKIKLSL